LPVRVPAGDGVSRGLDRTGSAPVDGYLWLDVLHADRLPRSARDDRRDHAVDHLAARAEGPLHAATSLRVRSGRLGLALRRRRLARPVYFRVLAVEVYLPGGIPCGAMSPAYQASIKSRNKTTDSPTRQVSARAIFRESSTLRGSLPPLLR